ncbi:hypothetical protein L6452_14730 [Arctium lappa]|uniref:Uncharacterized protein n=1 Tax=Arctium lappa TaxID=4217 RepID=A0ACB9CLV9_ARCLA|nr:hypothetical protein L6452_14730 [Arctium lappa]
MQIQIGFIRSVLEFATTVCPARQMALPLLFVIGRITLWVDLMTVEPVIASRVVVFGDNIVDASLLCVRLCNLDDYSRSFDMNKKLKIGPADDYEVQI